MVPNETEGGEGGETVTDGVIEVSAIVVVVVVGEDGGVEVLAREQVGIGHPISKTTWKEILTYSRFRIS